MAINWLNKSYGVLDLSGPKGVQDPHAKNDQSLLASRLDARVSNLSVEQQTLRTTSSLTQDALRKALDAVKEDASEIFSRLDQLERSLDPDGGDPVGTLGLTSFPPEGAAGGDLSDTYPNPSVSGLRGRPISNVAPVEGDLYRFSNGFWRPWSPKYMTATLSGNQTSNVTGGNHVEFNSIRADSGHITLSTGVDQAQGIFTVPKGDWQVTLVVNANYNGALGLIGVDLVEDPGGTVLSAARARDRSYSAADNESRAPVSSQVISLASATDVKAEIAQSAIVNAIQSATHINFVALA